MSNVYKFVYITFLNFGSHLYFVWITFLTIRCDQTSDCYDGSDEADCSVVKTDVSKYQKHVPPPSGTKVYLDIDIKRFNNIDEV